MARNIETKAKVVTKDAGDASVIKTSPMDRIVLGVLVGMVHGTITRKLPTGGTYDGLKGAFRMTPADEAMPVVRAGICYLPDALHQAIVKEYKEPETVQFAFEITTVKADNSDGYALSYKPLVEIKTADPLGELMAAAGVAGADDVEKEAAPVKAGGKK